MLRIAIVVVALAGSALAQPIRTLEVEVDATVEVEVGTLIGFLCDHPKLVEARMKTKRDPRGVEVNVFSVKGLAPGKTQCRVGSEALGASRLFEVVVREKR